MLLGLIQPAGILSTDCEGEVLIDQETLVNSNGFMNLASDQRDKQQDRRARQLINSISKFFSILSNKPQEIKNIHSGHLTRLILILMKVKEWR